MSTSDQLSMDFTTEGSSLKGKHVVSTVTPCRPRYVQNYFVRQHLDLQAHQVIATNHLTRLDEKAARA